jgi:hypothetical protein
MFPFRYFGSIAALILCVATLGCGGTNQFGSQPGGGSGTASVVLTMTDTPPTTVTILSAEATLTGATLTPGNVSLFSGSANVELTKLQTDIAYIATATNIPAGNFTALNLTFANPSLTIENDTGSVLDGCAVGAICTITPATTTLSATAPLTSFTLSSGAAQGLLIDVNLDNLLSATLGADFSAGTSVTTFTPAGTNAPPVGAEDVVGQVESVNASANTFTLTNPTGSYSLKVNTSSSFFQFPLAGACTAQGFACLVNNQIVSVDIGILADGTLQARNIVFEDADSSDAEVEGIVTSTNVGSQQFNMVVLTVSSSGTNVNIGEPVTVQYTASPQTPFAIDFVHGDALAVSTSGYLFAAPTDLAVGQQISVRRNSSSSGTTIKADRIELRSTRLTGTVQTIGSGILTLSNLPSLFFGHGGITLIQAQTSTPTIFFEIGKTINISDIALSDIVSVRGPLFNVSGSRTLVASKVVLKP